jgi:hypothetical protein
LLSASHILDIQRALRNLYRNLLRLEQVHVMIGELLTNKILQHFVSVIMSDNYMTALRKWMTKVPIMANIRCCDDDVIKAIVDYLYTGQPYCLSNKTATSLFKLLYNAFDPNILPVSKILLALKEHLDVTSSHSSMPRYGLFREGPSGLYDRWCNALYQLLFFDIIKMKIFLLSHLSTMYSSQIQETKENIKNKITEIFLTIATQSTVINVGLVVVGGLVKIPIQSETDKKVKFLEMSMPDAGLNLLHLPAYFTISSNGIVESNATNKNAYTLKGLPPSIYEQYMNKDNIYVAQSPWGTELPVFEGDLFEHLLGEIFQ